MYEYFKSRGLSFDTVKKYNLKEEDGFVRIPYYDANGEYLYCKCRGKANKSFWYWPRPKELCLYNLQNLSAYKDYVVITEGEIDCLSLLQNNINAVGCPGAKLFKKEWADLLSGVGDIYIAFDNDLPGIEAAIKIAEECFINRDTYNILVPREAGTKDINDLLLMAGYKREDYLRLIKQATKHNAKINQVHIKKPKAKEKPKLKVSRFLSGEKLGEVFYSKVGKSSGFAVYDLKSGVIDTLDSFEDEDNIYLPDLESELILNRVVRIPECALEHGDTYDLLSDLHSYINKYVDIENENDRDIVATYVLLSWVYQRFSSIPYLRILGDYGCGKSRLLKVLNVCYKSIYTSGNASEAPIFRLVHKYGGTLIIDEAELSRNNDRCEGIKEILRFGKDRDGVVARCDGQNFEVKTYRVFGPKILGSRRTYADDALESRIINIKMKETKASHIPLNLDIEEFEKDANDIRSKLLDWSLKNYFKVDINIYKDFIDSSVSMRINEMNSPLICLRHKDSYFVEGLLAKSKNKFQSLMEDKSESLEANIVNSISDLYDKKTGNPLLKDIVDNLAEMGSKNYSARFIGSIIRDNLGLATSHTRDGNIVVVDMEKLTELKKEYNLKDL